MASHWWMSSWGFTPLAIAALLTLVSALYSARSKPEPAAPAAQTGGKPAKAAAAKPLRVDKSFFEGPGLTNAGAVSTVLSLLPLLVAEEVSADPIGAPLLAAASLLFALSTFFGLWLYSMVATHPLDGGSHTEGQARFLIGLQAAIVGWMVVGAGCFVVFIVASPALSPQPPDARPAPAAAMVLQCDAKGCKLAPK